MIIAVFVNITSLAHTNHKVFFVFKPIDVYSLLLLIGKRIKQRAESRKKEFRIQNEELRINQEFVIRN